MFLNNLGNERKVDWNDVLNSSLRLYLPSKRIFVYYNEFFDIHRHGALRIDQISPSSAVATFSNTSQSQVAILNTREYPKIIFALLTHFRQSLY